MKHTIELLVAPDCPNAQPTFDLAAEALEAFQLPVEIEKTTVESQSQAQDFDFHGSPTLRIDGQDIDNSWQGSAPALACRVYPGGSGVPPRWLVEAALVRALEPRSILFLCVANSARSQMAEGLARAMTRAMASPGVEVASAGSAPSRVRPEVAEVLAEVGVDMTGHRAKGLAAVGLDSVELVVTLCAEQVCPLFPRPVARVHWPLPDPAAVEGGKAARLEAFRAVRDELALRLSALLGVGVFSGQR